MIMEAATCYAAGLYLTAIAEPTTDPSWDYSTSEGTWQFGLMFN